MDTLAPLVSLCSAFRFLLNLEHRYGGALPCTQLWASVITCKFLQSWKRHPRQSSVWICVSNRGAPTPAGTSMFTMWKLCIHKVCELRHNWDMGMGHLWLNGWGIHGLMGGTFMAYWVGHLQLKWVGQSWLLAVSFGKMLKKMLVFRGVPFPIIAWQQVSVPLNSRPVAHYREGGTTPHLRLVLYLRSPALDWLSQYY